MSNWICSECGANYIDVSHQEPSVLREELELRKTKEQLAIAVKRLEFLQKKTAAPYDLRAYKPIYEMVTKTLQQIKELEK